MTMYATVNGSGVATGFYSDAIHQTIPEGAIALTNTQYQAWIANTQGQSWNGTELVAYTPPAPTLTLAQQAAAQLGQGVGITSTATPALDGTYACDAATQGRIASISVYILVNGGFPGGVSSYPWLDVAGAAHVFPSTAEFQQFASAIANYVAVLDMVISTGAGTLPAATIAIP